ncbi:Re/Si-specific NAD(P)(+) transhydrogenase subunit alpha [Alloacidobacterium sp.]|uniref:Re/Si-specific NAD(P)(+) transhydrogenase subunit alpha n=1 Tax=Alloacidobacterium sp. TaxID=2951999 RepID=UPI002D2309A4|nr:Re/Si-specific NAD(P)(+) transhydrogenase subunit alpha [Alloacidobacterium sp.]HYK35944.1 Re/Si-specific NAD(P)(+) transhydrogenase subunit alpha [Alloacidobacterium sp.]
MPGTLGTLLETFPQERRVALIPRQCEALKKAGLEVIIEQSAGAASGFPDEMYVARGARIGSREDVFREADIIAQVRCLGANPEAGRSDLDLLRPGQILIGFCEPLTSLQECSQLAAAGASLLALELIPRITRAQSMDALSSMATISGYRAVLMGASQLPKMFPLLMTAAGTLTPARVFVLGAGVAGLQVIATARRLGAVVCAYDVRPAVKEQVESVGAKFVMLDVDAKSSEDKGGYAKAMDEEFYCRQRELLTEVLREQDVVITTAAVPGRKSPILITAEMVSAMPAGSVIVDIAAERGGNCELTRAGETVVHQGVTILGPVNIPSLVPHHASQMLSANITAVAKLLLRDGNITVNLEDEIIRESLVTHQGKVVHPRVAELAAVAG